MGITKSKQVLEAELKEAHRVNKELQLENVRIVQGIIDDTLKVEHKDWGDRIKLPLSGGIILGVIGFILGCIVGTLL